MTETAGRIRWEDKTPGNGDVYNVASVGYVGTRPESAFIIYTPDELHAGWLLSVRLTPGSQFFYAASRDELKDRAGRWLEEFTASIGAAFPGEPDCSAVTRFEAIDHTRGLASISQVSTRAVVVYGASVKLSFQDDGQTLKVFLTDPAKEAGQ